MQNNNNIVISKSDKGTIVVILNKQDYNNKITDILNNATKFKILGSVHEFDNTAQKEQCKLFWFYNEHLITKKIYEIICRVRSQRPWLYGLPKIHKHNIPLRPVLSMVSSVQHQLAKWLADILEQLHSQHCLIDSFTFINQIQNISIDSNNWFFWSFNIMSLYTNVPVDKTITICNWHPIPQPPGHSSCSRIRLFETDTHCY